MECIFNELSAMIPAKDKSQAMEWMQTLLNTCKEVNYLIINKRLLLRVSHDFKQIMIAENYAIKDWLFDKNIDHISRSLLHRLMDSPVIGKKIQEERYILTKTFEYKDDDTIQAQEAEGLGIAYLTGEYGNGIGTLAISFNSHPRWDKTEMPLLHFINGTVKPEDVKVKHASKPPHVDVHKVWILKSNDFNWDNWQPSLDNLLPRVNLSNKLVKGDWEKFRDELGHLQSQEKNAKIEEMAKNVAEINGYTYNQKLSSSNHKRAKSLRSIYEAGESRQKMYLSTDFEKGAFEVCDHKGRHLGEYSFSGEQTKDADNTGKHDIYLHD